MSSEVQQILQAVRSLCDRDNEELVIALDRDLHGSKHQSKRELIESIRGKYAHLPNSSADFLARKREDVASES